MFVVIKNMIIVLLTSIVNASNYTKCVSLNNQKFEIQATPINLHLNEYSQELNYYPFTVRLDKCVGSCNTLYDLSLCSRYMFQVCVPNKKEDLNIHIFNMITGKNDQNF